MLPPERPGGRTIVGWWSVRRGLNMLCDHGRRRVAAAVHRSGDILASHDGLCPTRNRPPTEGIATMIRINGVAHTNITVSNWAACRAFYDALLPFLGLQRVFHGDEFIYYVGARTGVGIGRCDPAYEHERFVQNRVGLHHLCFRARSREDVDTVHDHLVSMQATIVHPPEHGGWAPGYYSVLFEDPAGTRLEVNFVPGAGVLADDASFDPGPDYR